MASVLIGSLPTF